MLTSLGQAGNKHTRIVTLDLNEPAALDMVKAGNVAALIVEDAYSIGVTAARAAALALLDRPIPPFLAVDSLIVTSDNLQEGWENHSIQTCLPPYWRRWHKNHNHKDLGDFNVQKEVLACAAVVAIERFFLNAYPGEIVVLFGDNGAGKSTLVKIISGIYLPTSGMIRM